MLRKRLKMFTIIILVIFIISGCTQVAKENKNTGTSTGNEQQPPAPTNEKIEISWVSWNCGDIEDGNFVEKKLEEKLNLEIKVKKVDLSKTQQVDLMLASGEMPDCGWIFKDPRDMYYSQELTRTVPVDMIRQYAPMYSKLIDDYPLLWKINASNEDKNELIALPGCNPSGTDGQYYFSSFYRYDWLQKFGIKPSTPVEMTSDRIYVTEKGFTLDEFKVILDKFVNGDPDGNGVADTYGMIGYTGANSWRTIQRAFGFQDGFSMEEEGKAIMPYSSQKYKDYIKYVNSLYKNGLVDKEILTLPADKFFEKGTTGKAGYFCNTANLLGEWAEARPPLSILKNVPESTILMTPGQLSSDGSYGTMIYNTSPVYNNFFIRNDVSDEKLKRILQLFDYASLDEEGSMICWWGEEGTHYDIDPATSTPVKKENVTANGKIGFGVFAQYVRNERIAGWFQDSMFKATGKYTIGKDALWTKNMYKPYKLDLFNETKLNEYNKTYGSNIGTIVSEFFANAIIGEINVDTEWDAYIKKLNDNGYDKIVEELNKAPLYADLIK